MLRALVFALSVAGCASTATPDATPSAPPVSTAPGPTTEDTVLVGRIALGETVTVGTETVRFDGVAEDSRCPQNVTCVWEGRARVRLVVGGSPVVFTVGSAEATAPLRVGDRTFDVTALDPFPGSPEAESGTPPSAAFVVRQG